MANNIQTKEFNRIFTQFVNGYYLSVEDGDFDFMKDYAHFIGALTAIQPGIKGAKEMKDENINMDIPAREEVLQSMFSEMPNVNQSDRYDIASGMHGIWSLIRLSWRKGHERGRESLIEEIRDGKVKVEDLV